MKELWRKIDENSADVAVFGLGYVGLPLAVSIASQGHKVTGVDIDKGIVRRLRDGRSHIKPVTDKQLSFLRESGKIEFLGLDAFGDSVKAGRCPDVFLVCVPTPVSNGAKPDLSWIRQAAGAICSAKSEFPDRQCLVIVESTTYPGVTTEEIIKPLSSLQGTRPYVAHSPERLDPGADHNADLAQAIKIVGGENEEATQLAGLFYSRLFRQVYPCFSVEEAEAIKVIENCFRFLSCVFANKLAEQCMSETQDAWSKLKNADKSFGQLPKYLGRIAEDIEKNDGAVNIRRLALHFNDDATKFVDSCPDCSFPKLVEEEGPIASTYTFSHIMIQPSKVQQCFGCMSAIFLADILSFLRRSQIDAPRVLKGIATKDFGLNVCLPGPGVGGHCIPVDPMYLFWRADQIGVPMPILWDCFHYNSVCLPQKIVGFAKSEIAAKGLDLNQCIFVLLGITYKKNVPDMRTAPSMGIVRELRKTIPDLGNILYFDPIYDEMSSRVWGHKPFVVDTVQVDGLSEAGFKGLMGGQTHKCIMILDDHDEFRKSGGAYELLTPTHSNNTLVIDFVDALQGDCKEVIEKIVTWGGV